MKRQQSLLFFSALLLCTFQQTAGSSRARSSSSSSSVSEEGGSHRSRPLSTLREDAGRAASFSSNSSRENETTVISKRSSKSRWIPEDEESPLCAYRVLEGGIGGPLCFRNTLPGYKCNKGACRTAVSSGNLEANILTNGSVLLTWTSQEEAGEKSPNIKAKETAREESVKASGRRHRRGGYELSCWWNGSYTQFECAGVHLGKDCRDFLLSDLHENIPYRLCLRSLEATAGRAEPRRDCVEFTLPPSGMQDIVIAMTTVGGAICVMLVIICLLVAYITENIMSPSTTQHSYSYRTHSRH